jgi:HEPN domain-containing protein
MALPRAAEARVFYQAAQQRLLDAQYLLEDNRNTGAVYLSGYAVECILKALILSMVPRKGRASVLDSFRGSRAHDYRWLERLYRQKGGPVFPAEISKGLIRVHSWTTSLRYHSGALRRREAEAFVETVVSILEWADGRL